jgi:GNAT superfamily N-acetyltransferase
MITIRRAEPEDAAAVLGLCKSLFDELDHRFPSTEDKSSLSLCRNLMGNDSYTVFLAFDSKNSVCGIITLNEGASIYTGGKFGVIREFYVIPEMRSSGIGKALLDTAKGFVRTKGWKRLEVTPPHKEKWIRTYDFYMKEGFTEIGPRLKLENLNGL